MGTGSRGGGSGAGSSGGGRSGGSSVGGYTFENGIVKSKFQNQGYEEIVKIIKKILHDPNRRAYFLREFGNPLVCKVYEHLFVLYQQLVLNHSWDGIFRVYGIIDEPGCLKKWVVTIIEQNKNLEPDSRMSDEVWGSLKKYISQALGAKTDLYFSGTGSEVVHNLDSHFMRNISNNFLAKMINEVLFGEVEMSNPSTETVIKIGQASQNFADHIVNSFEDKFHNKQGIPYKDLFSVINKEQDWFLKVLRG
jgi:hypothetical protein